MIHLYTGNGKGKTTAALGLALRAVGDGKRVFMIQFIKGPWPSGEDKSRQVFGDQFVLVKGGKGFVGILNDTIPRAEHEQAARDTLERAKTEIQSGVWDIVILDEVNVACDLKLISAKDVLTAIGSFSEKKAGEVKNKKPELIILTGRGAPRELYEIADLITEMREIKHYYNDGQIAKRGVEY